jgi:hypothetical protein
LATAAVALLSSGEKGSARPHGVREPTAKEDDMASVIYAANFHEALIFDLVERLLDYALATEGVRLLNVETIRLLRRTAEVTEGFPSEAVQEAYEEIFLRDIWKKLPSNERRLGVIRQFTADRLELASLPE